MDQVKEYLKIAIKYRFWIIVGIAAILPLAGYFSAAGEIEAATKKKEGEIKGADSGVKPFQSGLVTNPKWTQLTDQKKAVLTADVNKSWRKLYERQAPFLDWPPQVEAEFKAWGNDWPKDVDRSQIDLVINRYVQVYPDYVTRVFESFHPWNPETGEGIVVTVPKEELLRPAVFDVRNPPTLSKVHVAQKRLWIQRTLLDVVRAVNEKAGAKDWDSARIKQITALEVASSRAQDQKSAAKGDVLEAPPEIDPTVPAAPATGTGGTLGAPTVGGGGGGRAGGGGGGSGQTDPAAVKFIKSEAPNQYFVVPVALGVLIDQDHIPEFLVEFENSPMSIQVFDFDWERPGARIQKPVKGEDTSSALFGGIGSREGVGGMRGGRGMGPGQGGMIGLGGQGGMRGPGLGGPGGNTGAPSKGTNVSGQNLQIIRDRDKAEKEAKKNGTDKKAAPKPTPQNTIADPYFNIVEVHIYGRARFYLKPPDEPAPPASAPGATPPPPPPPPTTPEPPKTEAPKPAEPPKDAPKAEETKKDAPPADTKAEPPKPDAPKDAAPTPDAKAEGPKPDEKAESPKPEPPKADPKKDESPKK